MPISTRLVVRSAIGLLTIGFLTLFGIVGMTVWLNERAQMSANAAVLAQDTRLSAVELRDSLRTAESSQRGFLITGNEIYLAPFDSAKVSARRHLQQINAQLEHRADIQPMLRRLGTDTDDKLEEMDRTIALKKDRRDSDALASFRTNRGKALMDEINVFLHSITLSADEKIAASVEEQRLNAAFLRWVSIAGAIVILAVVGGVVLTVLRYTAEIASARDEVRALNIELERRVEQRTSELVRARDRAEILLVEVNHRVANSLMLVASLVRLQSNAVRDQSARDALSETEGRIYAISSVHKWLYGSGDVRIVALNEYLSSLLDHLQTSMRAEGHGSSLRYELEALRLPTDASVNLGIIVAELVTNAFKYAYPDRPGEVRVRLANRVDGHAEVVVEDDGVGRVAASPAKGTGFGTRIINAMASAMSAKVSYEMRYPGTTAQVVFRYAPETAHAA